MSQMRRSGPLDDQAHIVRARAAHVVAEMIVSFQGGVPEGDQWIPRHSDPDPRLYFDPVTKTARPQRAGTKARLARLAEFFATQSYGEESPQKWARDITGWLGKKQTVSPEKLRWLAKRFNRSWIEALNGAGYLQHIIALMDLLVEKEPKEAAILAAFTFRMWISTENHEQQLATLDLFAPHGLFERSLMKMEESSAAQFWPKVPARVSLDDIRCEDLRCVFRLCDPSESGNRSDLTAYPSRTVRAASTFLVKRLFAEVVDFSPVALRSLIQEVIK